MRTPIGGRRGFDAGNREHGSLLRVTAVKVFRERPVAAMRTWLTGRCGFGAEGQGLRYLVAVIRIDVLSGKRHFRIWNRE